MAEERPIGLRGVWLIAIVFFMAGAPLAERAIVWRKAGSWNGHRA